VKVSSDKSSDHRNAGALFSLGGLLFLLLTTVSEAVYPNFSLQTNAISDAAAVGASTFAVEETAILGAGLCWAVGAYYLFRGTGRRRMLVLNVLPGLGFLLAGVSPENVNVAIHSVGALLAFPFGGIVAILSFRMIRSQYRYFAVALGALSLVSTFVTFVGGQIAGPCGSCTGSTTYIRSLEALALGLGGWESMIIYPLLLWLIGFGGYLLASGNAGSFQ
jgi:hypothetical membrane protein